MKILEVDISEIKPYENNPRLNDDAVDAVAASIQRFGWKQPIVIDRNGVIVVGHTRYKAAKQLGREKIPCIMADDLTEEEIRAYRLADNKVAELADWDLNGLDIELDNIIDIDMSEFGFSIENIETDDGKKEIKELIYHDNISVVIDCSDEFEAEKIFNALTEEGYKCRISIL